MHSMGLVTHPLAALAALDGSPLNMGSAPFTTLEINKRWLALVGLPKRN